MRAIFAILIVSLIPAASHAAGLWQRESIDTNARHLEYKCIEEHRDRTNEELRACVKEKQKSFTKVNFDKRWSGKPNKHLEYLSTTKTGNAN